MKPRSSIIRLAGLFVLLSLVPLAVLTGFTVHLASDAVGREVRARVRSTAAVSAVAVQKEMQGLGELVESFANRPTLLTALADPGHYDLSQVDLHLTQLQQGRPGIATASKPGRMSLGRPKRLPWARGPCRHA